MNLKTDRGALVYRQFNSDVRLPIADMTKKVYDYNNKQVFINTILNTKSRQFIFKLSEIGIPKFANFDDMVLWFDTYVILAGGTTSVSHNNLTDRNGDPLYLHLTEEEKESLLNASSNIDGGSASSVYIVEQIIDSGGA